MAVTNQITQIRSAEILALLSLSTDLARGRRLGQALFDVAAQLQSEEFDREQYYRVLTAEVVDFLSYLDQSDRVQGHGLTNSYDLVQRRLRLPDVAVGESPSRSEELDGAHVDAVVDSILALEPEPHLVLTEAEIDEALAFVGDVADLVAPTLTGHSRRVSRIAGLASTLAGFSEEQTTAIRRAGSLHDVGRLAIERSIWNKPAALTPGEVSEVQRHTSETQRILQAIPSLADLSDTASQHHEHLDGSGYHTGIRVGGMGRASRLMAVADIFSAMREPRPHRPALPTHTAIGLLKEGVRAGHLDSTMVDAVIEIAPQLEIDLTVPGLSTPEVRSLVLYAQGLSNEDAAEVLGADVGQYTSGLSRARGHIGADTRHNAALFVMENNLIH